MGLTGVKINRVTGGLGRQELSADGDCLLIIQGAKATTKLAIGVIKTLYSVEDAVAQGIDATYDSANKILAHYHIMEFFETNPNGKLFIVLDDGKQTTTQFKNLIKANTSIRAIGIVRNSVTQATDTVFTKLVGDWQKVVTDLETDTLRVDSVFLEANISDSVTSVSSFTDMRKLKAKNVSIVTAQDPNVRALLTEYKTHAAIGTALGHFSVRSVNENLGSVDIQLKPDAYKGQKDFPLTRAKNKRWYGAVLQNGKNFHELTTTEIKELATKGYIAIGNYSGYGGYFFTDSHTAELTTSDYSRIENNRVWNKAARLVRNALLPKVKSNLLKDPVTGYIAETAAKELEGLALAALEKMEAAAEISGKDVHIPTNQTLTNDVALKVKVQVVFNGIIFTIEVDLGLTNKIT